VNTQAICENQLFADNLIENKDLGLDGGLGEEWLAMVAGGTPVVNAI
jgi:hypothetical protein